jgi:hypothetical protein
MSTYESANESE